MKVRNPFVAARTRFGSHGVVANEPFGQSFKSRRKIETKIEPKTESNPHSRR